MNKETLDHLELCIFAEQTHDVNFQNIAKELFKEVCFQKKEIERLNKECDAYMKIATKRGNIIEELEKDLQSKIDKDKLNLISNPHWLYVLDKLKSLKEGK